MSKSEVSNDDADDADRDGEYDPDGDSDGGGGSDDDDDDSNGDAWCTLRAAVQPLVKEAFELKVIQATRRF